MAKKSILKDIELLKKQLKKLEDEVGSDSEDEAVAEMIEANKKSKKTSVKKSTEKSKSTGVKMYDNKCIKCSAAYRDEYPDPYYCAPCKIEHKKLAEEIAKKAPKSSERRIKDNAWDILDSGGKVGEFSDPQLGRGYIFSPSSFKRK